ncbi:unnamed protein product, partial [Cladocopium goreaui]
CGSQQSAGPVYTALRQVVEETTHRGALDLSVLRLNFNPSRKFQHFYRVGRLLGDGSFGAVHECFCRTTNEARAVKLLLKSRIKDGGAAIANEIEILTKLDHPHVVRFYEFFEDSRSVLCVVELCEHGDLSSVLDKPSGQDSVRVLYRDVMLGLAYLHSFGIAHRDLKFTNCVLAWNGLRDIAKIIDFGLGAIRREEDVEEEWMSEVLGTLAFVAPEVVQKSYSEKCDCWSFGIMVFMQLTQGQHPYGGSWRGRSNLPNRQLLMRLQDPPRLELLCTADARGSELVARLLAHEPQQRLSAQEALQMAWLRPKSIRRVERSCNLSHREQSLMRRSLSSYKDLTSFDKALHQLR